MASLLLVWLLLVGSPRAMDCADVDSAVLDSHAGWAYTAWRAGDDARFAEAHALLLGDVSCLVGSGLRTRNAELFLVLARGALDVGDDARALAALRALLVIQGDYQPDPAMLPYDQPLAPLFAMAQVLGPDAAGFEARFLGKDPGAQANPPPAAPAQPSPEALEAQRRAELLARVRAEVETDRRAHHAGTVTATVGGLACGLSLAFIAARNTSGENKPNVEPRPQREAMGKVWTGTAIGGAATMGLGLWLMHVSQLDAGPGMPVVGWSGRF